MVPFLSDQIVCRLKASAKILDLFLRLADWPWSQCNLRWACYKESTATFLCKKKGNGEFNRLENNTHQGSENHTKLYLDYNKKNRENNSE